MTKGSDGMALHFRTLTLDAVACPSAYVRVHSGPHISSGDKVLSCSDPWVREAVQRIEDSTSPGGRDERAVRSS